MCVVVELCVVCCVLCVRVWARVLCVCLGAARVLRVCACVCVCVCGMCVCVWVCTHHTHKLDTSTLHKRDV